ncbi:erythromycin esterase [Streptomyces badius]
MSTPSTCCGHAPLDPAHLARIDGIVFMKDVPED